MSLITSRGQGQLHRRSKKIAWQGHGPYQHAGSRPQLTSGARAGCRNRAWAWARTRLHPVLLYLTTVIKAHDGPQQQPVAAVAIHPFAWGCDVPRPRCLVGPVGGPSAAICHQSHLPAPEPVAPLFQAWAIEHGNIAVPSPPFPSIRALLVLGARPPPPPCQYTQRQFSLFGPDMQPILPRPGPETHLVHDLGPQHINCLAPAREIARRPPPLPPPGRGCDGSADDRPRQVASSASGPPDQRGYAPEFCRPIQSPTHSSKHRRAQSTECGPERQSASRPGFRGVPSQRNKRGAFPPYQVQGRIAKPPFSLPTAPRRSIAPSRCEPGEARSA